MTASISVDSAPGHYAAAEIASQPECWQRAAQLTGHFDLFRRPGQKVAIAGCGTSWFVAQSIAALRESGGYGVTDAFAASEARLDGRDYDALIALSRSGTTTEVEALLAAAPAGVRKVAVVSDASSPVAQLADEVIELSFADEKSVVQTRFATTTVALAMAAFGLDLDAAIADTVAAAEIPLPQHLIDTEQVVFLGSGWTVGLVHEAALKLREASQSWTEAYPAMEYRHGPMSLAAPGRTVWIFGPAPDGLVEEIRQIGGTVISTSAHPLSQLVAAQRLALARADARGLDADTPRNLVRSIILS